MKYKRQLRCIKDYDEDLTGNDDFATVWTAGKVYEAVKHHRNIYSLKQTWAQRELLVLNIHVRQIILKKRTQTK